MLRKINVRFSTAQAFKALGLICAATIFCTVAAFQGTTASNQKANETHKTAHDAWGYYQNVALLPPVKITEVDGNRLYWAYDGQGIHIGSLDLEADYSIVPAGFSKENFAGCYGIHYCKQHLIVLTMDRIPDKLCQSPVARR